jgi:endoglucanase
MYIDIGAKNKEDAESKTELGASGTFDSEFVVFGENNSYIKGKAIDDRLGCAEMLYALEAIKGENIPLDLWFCFTVREEIGLSGARTAAQAIAPDYSVVLESTAVADLPDVSESKKVAKLGNGGAISLSDRSTIYDRGLVRFIMELASKKGIKAQYKQYVSGGNDAGSIHKSGAGVKALAISAPSRYIHSPACVVSYSDYISIGDLLVAFIKEFDMEMIENA